MRSRQSRSAVGVLAAALAVMVVVPGGPAGTAAAQPTQSGQSTGLPPSVRSGPAGTVTLVTGDRVTVGGSDHAVVQPAKGREKVRFAQRIDVNGDLQVVPVDVEPAVRSGRLDPRLFNVTQLIKHRFDDRSRTDIPLIVTYGGSRRVTAARVGRELPSVGGTAVRVDKSAGFWSEAAGLRAVGIERVWLDGPVRASLDKSVPQIGAPVAWRSGLTGKDTKVAVLDTGIDTTHPDLDDAVVDAKDFTESESGTADRHGHGTHVASIVTGDHDTYKGVAPDTKLLNGKVLGDDGGGSESGIIAGMEWAASAGADVINMSLGGQMPSAGKDPISAAVNRLTEQTGALFVVSAGNTGGTPSSPAAADAALTVGAVDGNDALAKFSSRGPRWKDDAIKPDITAPGVEIVAARAKDSFLGDNSPTVGEHHLRLSGTSMASPHVAGAAAILAQQHPDWKAADLKAALMGTAKPNPSLSVFEQGAGRVDIAKATTTSVRGLPGSLSLGIVQWPHHDDQPITKHLTYHNTGTASITLPTAVDVRDPAGKPAPTGMFTVTPAALTIPAGGTAQATVTTKTATTGPDGIYSGVVTAGDIRTPIAINREVESYDVRLNFLGFDGKPSPNYSFRFVDIDHRRAYPQEEVTGPDPTVRVPKGRYYVDTSVGNDDWSRSTVAVEPTYPVTGDAEFTVDARDGQLVGFVVDKPNARPGQAIVSFLRDTEWGGDKSTGLVMAMPNFDGLLIRPSKSAAALAEFEYGVDARMAEPDSAGGFSTSGYLYHVRTRTQGKIPAQLVTRVRDSELARVRSHHAATKPGTFGAREAFLVRPLPYALNEFYTPRAPWYGSFGEMKNPDDSLSYHAVLPRSFRLGRTTTERWNQAVFGPAFPKYPDQQWGYAGRLGNVVGFSIPLYTDQVGGREGYALDTGTTTLFRDGEQIGSEEYSGFGEFRVPAGPGRYRLHTEATRDNPLSSKIITNWSFTSDTVVGETPAALPLLAVRFAPKVDDHNRAAAKVPTVIPVRVDHNTGGTGRVTGLQVSHDEGTTWKPARLITIGGKTFTIVKHPKGATSVSLKATAKDAAGSTVDQTIIKAFVLK